MFITILFSICLTLFIAYSFYGNPLLKGIPNSVDMETAKELVLKKAKKNKHISFTPSTVTQAEISNPPSVFSNVHFLYVWGEFGHAENSPFAVSHRSSVFKLPEEFNLLLKKEGVRVEDEKEAQQLVEFYLQFDIVMPGLDKHHILTDILNIPNSNEEEPLVKYQNIIKPLSITSDANGWVLEFFTWQEVGNLFHWKTTISKEGEFDIEKKELIGSLIGDYLMIE